VALKRHLSITWKRFSKISPHYTEIEFSWVADFNPKMRKIFVAVGCVPVKDYITFSICLTGQRNSSGTLYLMQYEYRTKNQEPKSRIKNQEPGIKNQNQESRTKNQESRTRNQEPESRNKDKRQISKDKTGYILLAPNTAI